MDLDMALTIVEERAVAVEARIKTNEAWLTSGFLADADFTPRYYLLRAECQKELQRELAAITAWLPDEFPNARAA
jgi:hypothetical protein